MTHDIAKKIDNYSENRGLGNKKNIFTDIACYSLLLENIEKRGKTECHISKYMLP